MRGDDARRCRGIGRVLGCGGCDAGYGDGGCVCGEDGMRRTDLGQGREDGEFQGGDLGHGFDYEIYVCEGIH